MAHSHDRFTHTSGQLTTSLRTETTPVVTVRASESCKCQTSISIFCRDYRAPSCEIVAILRYAIKMADVNKRKRL